MEELKHLAEIREVVSATNSAGWQHIQRQMQLFVAEAYEEMIGNTSHDPMSYMHLQLRWQQREAMLRGVKQYVRGCEEEKQDLLTQAKLERSSGEDYAERSEDVGGWQAVG